MYILWCGKYIDFNWVYVVWIFLVIVVGINRLRNGLNILVCSNCEYYCVCSSNSLLGEYWFRIMGRWKGNSRKRIGKGEGKRCVLFRERDWESWGDCWYCFWCIGYVSKFILVWKFWYCGFIYYVVFILLVFYCIFWLYVFVVGVGIVLDYRLIEVG